MSYLFYDKQTGRIVHTHSAMHVDPDKKAEVDLPALRKSIGMDAFVLKHLTAGDASNLDVLETPDRHPFGQDTATWMVDPVHKKLVRAPSLTLKSDKRELAGDGKDEASIEIQVVDENGRPLHDFEGQVKVTTSRGRLSARGGIVNLERGSGSLKLTSAGETVDRVLVRAKLLTGVSETGTLTLEFV